MLPIQSILHPTDFSTRSDQAFQLACSLARENNARMIVLHVIDMPTASFKGVSMAPPTPPPSPEEQEALQQQLRTIQPPPGSSFPIEHRLVIGETAPAILQVAKDAHCDLIVMGTHGRTGLSRLLMGSVAEEVLRKAPCPVLSVRGPMAE